MVVIEVRSNGAAVRRCDAGCYDAKGSDCHCICGGANHGVGLRIALEDRCWMDDKEILAECKNLLPGDIARVFKSPRQLELWPSPAKEPKKKLDVAG